MIKGIGIDMCDVEKMRKAVSRTGFAEKVFSEREILYAQGKANEAEHLAAAFAAKEALAKAGGWGLAKIGLSSCEVVRCDTGPTFNFSDDLRFLLDERGVKNVFLSITHESGMAAAVVVMEG
ncbi:MAG: holo-ACP synthase [Synergistes sp.]|nr:holo-ACP synthase [Synergistes sp.]